jgi:histone-lysine N-methyltransferase ASH1L
MKGLPKSKSQIGLTGSPRKAAKQQGGSRFRKSETLGSLTGSLTKKLSVLGKRSRQAFEDGMTGRRLTREERRLQDTAEFQHIDTEPVIHEVWRCGKLVKPEPANKRKKVEQAVEKPKPEEAQSAEKKPKKKPEKVWLAKGLYAGQDLKNPAQPSSKPNRTLPLPIFHGETLLHAGRPFKLPFDVCSPLPPGQPKPDEWRKTSSSKFSRNFLFLQSLTGVSRPLCGRCSIFLEEGRYL